MVQTVRCDSPEDSRTIEVQDDGSVLFGSSRVMPKGGDGAPDRDRFIPDFLYSGLLRRLFIRTLSLRELGDPPDLVLGRAGDGNYPDGKYPDMSDLGIKDGTNLGAIRWQGWHTCTDPKMAGFRRTSAAIYARAAEDLSYVSSLQVNSGGELWFQTTPRGSGDQQDRMVIRQDGRVDVLGKLTARAGVGVGNSVAANSLGNVIRKTQVFDAAGNPLGYVAIYDAIT